jgi:hypothetical protein
VGLVSQALEDSRLAATPQLEGAERVRADTGVDTKGHFITDHAADETCRHRVGSLALPDRSSVLTHVNAARLEITTRSRPQRLGEATVCAVVLYGAPGRRELEPNVLAAPGTGDGSARARVGCRRRSTGREQHRDETGRAARKSHGHYGVDLSPTPGNGDAGYGPILATVYSLAQKSGGPSLSATLLLTGFTPRFRYAAMSRKS